MKTGLKSMLVLGAAAWAFLSDLTIPILRKQDKKW